MSGRLRSAAAGATAATVWALQEPLDQRLLRCDYSDVAVLGKALTRGPRWRAAGLAIHAFDGALFGVAHHEVRRILPFGPRKLALGMALAEHVSLYPLCYLVDRYHPARGEPGIPLLLTNPRAFAQATWRHALFGILLGVCSAGRFAGGEPGRRKGWTPSDKRVSIRLLSGSRARARERTVRREETDGIANWRHGTGLPG